MLTNESSMIALTTLRQINRDLTSVQQEISTGRSISNARDNAAIWAVTTVMQSDVDGFEAISSSLDLGASTVSVARGAAETITGLLQNMKELIVSAQEDNVDRSKIQTDIDQLESQISTIVDAAQFNGLNLLKGTDSINILSSLNRASDGTVSTSNISVARSDLSIAGGEALDINSTATASATAGAGSGGTPASPGTLDLTVSGTPATSETFTVTVGGADVTFTTDGSSAEDADGVAAGLRLAIQGQIDASNPAFAGITVGGTGATVAISNTNASAVTIGVASDALGGEIAAAGSATEVDAQTPGTPNDTAGTGTISIGGTVTAGEVFTLGVGGTDFTYTAQAGDGADEVAAGLRTAIGANVTDVTAGGTGADVVVSNLGTGDVALTGAVAAANSSGLAAVATIDVTTSEGASAALADIEGLINVGIDAAAAFGSAQKRIDIQNEFLQTLTDSLKTGIGALVEADLEEASARLQSLQVQQQLGVQALSIANQRPQVLLGLFQ